MYSNSQWAPFVALVSNSPDISFVCSCNISSPSITITIIVPMLAPFSFRPRTLYSSSISKGSCNPNARQDDMPNSSVVLSPHIQPRKAINTAPNIRATGALNAIAASVGTGVPVAVYNPVLTSVSVTVTLSTTVLVPPPSLTVVVT